MHVLLLKLRNLNLAELVAQELFPIFVVVVAASIVRLCSGTLLREMMAKCDLGQELELLNLFQDVCLDFGDPVVEFCLLEVRSLSLSANFFPHTALKIKRLIIMSKPIYQLLSLDCEPIKGDIKAIGTYFLSLITKMNQWF